MPSSGFKEFTNDSKGEAEDYGKTLIGEPHEIDLQAAQIAGVDCEHLRLIGKGRVQLED